MPVNQSFIDGVTGLSRLSLSSTGQSVSPAIHFASEASLGLFRSAASTLALSYGTLNLNAANLLLGQGRLLSVRTLAASSVTASATNTNVATNEVVFVIGGASGASLIINSGGTTWIFNSAASAIQA